MELACKNKTWWRYLEVVLETDFSICRAGVARHSRLSDRIESVQKRALKVIYYNSSYSQALSLANETTLFNRREHICHKFMAEMTDIRDYPLSCLVSTAVQITNPYNLRPGSSRPFNKFIRTKRSENFFTFKYSSFKNPSWLSVSSGFLSSIIKT